MQMVEFSTYQLITLHILLQSNPVDTKKSFSHTYNTVKRSTLHKLPQKSVSISKGNHRPFITDRWLLHVPPTDYPQETPKQSTAIFSKYCTNPSKQTFKEEIIPCKMYLGKSYI
jgi:hypothetical protein